MWFEQLFMRDLGQWIGGIEHEGYGWVALIAAQRIWNLEQAGAGDNRRGGAGFFEELPPGFSGTRL